MNLSLEHDSEACEFLYSWLTKSCFKVVLVSQAICSFDPLGEQSNLFLANQSSKTDPEVKPLIEVKASPMLCSSSLHRFLLRSA